MRNETPSERPKFKNCRRYNDAGHAHALTFCCFRRQKFLASPRSCQWLVDAIDLARRKHQFDLWAYVIMPEHVHLVVCPRLDDYDVSRFLSTLKLSVTRKALAFVQLEAPASLPLMLDEQPNGQRHYRFWQRGGGFDRNLWSDKAIFAEIDYVHANPIRRGLCEKPEDWAWSSAGDYGLTRSGPLSIDFVSLPRSYEVVRHPRRPPPR
jgi:putative transposase